jgi:drug/metabolite transporter (DMT)-like permease
MPEQSSLSRVGLAHLAVVYLVWGSTYLAIRVAVRDGSGFPPFAMAGLRVAAAAALLLGWAAFKRLKLRLTRGDAVVLAGTGLMLWTAANGLVTWGERRADSGLAALLVATMPIWAALIDAVLDRRPPSFRLVVALLAGFLGVGLLSYPVLRQGTAADVWSVVGLLLAPFSWSLGSIWMRRRRPSLDILVCSGYQQLFGAIGFAAVALLVGEPVPRPIPEAWLGWGYLVVFGSVIAFTSYMRALTLLPVNVTMTYAYANPVIAVLLGWLVLNEAVTVWTLAGAALVIGGVAGVFQERARNGKRRAQASSSELLSA